ncbi:serine/threonine-protein phosphatase PP1 isozyme 2-like [Punica granatum]|uniref:Serine/threonine-protein phosphatase n=2 Tax=Punica granatum TaxID=22663 RepID=A0A218XY58_PUNGR|nr:serine/threonine-protein phosphatase PP1 isozyme 2-like [Punica granatum]OWM89222.1 hypothetical protein CDL15_Pgr010509 [Punica granatum]PKI67769.1 hypothetical protein CRG98_011819 [Punica granatum]
MPFKYHSFIPGDDDELNKARPGSPPAFFSLPSPASPRVCGNCIPGIAAGAAATSAAVTAAAHRSSVPIPSTRERLPQQHVRTEAAVEVKNQESASVEVPNSQSKNKAKGFILDHAALDDIIGRLLDFRLARPGKQVELFEKEVRHLCLTSKEIFLSQPKLLELETPINICGDIHGQYNDLLRVFGVVGFPSTANYLFLGNYVDYGEQSLETMCLLLAYKIKYPENFFLLRGNHECASINRIYGFYDECKRRFNVRLWKVFTDCFNCLPFAALVDNKIFCVHGGLSPDLTSLDQIRNIPCRTDVPDTGLLCDLLWSDPRYNVKGWGVNDRGASYTFGADKVSEFLKKHNLDLVCRGHQVVDDGYEFFAERQLVTLFSAPNYRGIYNNAGAIMRIDENLNHSFQILKPAERKLK